MAQTFLEVAGADPTSVRHRVLVALRDAGPLTRADLARRTSLAPPTITALTRDLLADGVLIETEPPTGERPRTGPRGTGLALNPALAHVIGVDVGYRTFRVMVCDASGREVGYAEAQLEPDHTAAEGMPLIRRLARTARRRAGVEGIVAAGVALRGPVDTALQQIATSGELAGWSGVGAGDLARVLGCPVTVENDANLAALGEHVYGAGRDRATTLTVKLHSGVGAGVIVADHLVTGSHGGAGELGHVPVVLRGGDLCRCGKRGCLDTRAAIPALLGGDVPDVGTLLARVEAGDPESVARVRDAAALVGRVLVTANLLLVPERILVVGALARAGEVVLEPLRDALSAGAVPGTRTVPDVVRGDLGDRPTVLGAAALVLRQSGWLAQRR